MLLYNKAVDLNHTILRLSAVLKGIDGKKVELDRLNIIDFILANPDYISKLQLGKDMVKSRNKFKKYHNKYNIYNSMNLFEMMKPVQNMAIQFMRVNNVITEDVISKRFHVDFKNMPEEIVVLLSNNINSIPKDALDFIMENLVSIDLVGPSGLKSASNLIGYKYDAI